MAAPIDFALWREAAPRRLALDDDQGHLWAVDLRAGQERAAAIAVCLSADERRRAAQFVFERDRRRFAICRAALRCLLSLYSGVAPAAHRFGAGPYRKPFLEGGAGPEFNVSHAGELALIVFARVPVGVDVERVRPVPDWDALARANFPREHERLLRLPPAQHELAFLLCWTCKEAYVKALGEGLHHPLDSFEVSVEPGAPARLRSPGPARWSLHHLDPAPGYVGALAVPQGALRLRAWRLEAAGGDLLESLVTWPA